jgi:Polyphosphate kinase 2 (PPK2)
MDTTSDQALHERINHDLRDSLDEELELELEDHEMDQFRNVPAPEDAKETLDRSLYFKELFRLQGELVKLQDWVQHNKLKVVVIFEGRDSAGKGGVIKRITQRLNPRVCRIAALPAPNERERAMVLPALRHASARRRRNRAVRPLLVQPRRRRARDGLRHGGAGRGVFSFGAGVRTHVGALRHHPDQILVLDHR